MTACKAAGQEIDLRMRDGYDHGYFFIQTFIAQHLDWHAHKTQRLRPRVVVPVADRRLRAGANRGVGQRVLAP